MNTVFVQRHKGEIFEEGYRELCDMRIGENGKEQDLPSL